MKRKILAMTMTGMLVMSMLAGCGTKDTETSVTDTVVSTQKEVTSNKISTESSVTMIQNTANELSNVITELQTAKENSFEKMVLTYQTESITITDKTINDHKTNQKFTAAKTEQKTAFLNTQGIPQVSLTFKTVTKVEQPLKIEVTWKDKEGAETQKQATVNINVVPESLKVVKPLTENQKISETVKKYDFDVFAKNVADNAKDAVESAIVKNSNVQFGKPGHYDVVYEVVLKSDKNTENVTSNTNKQDIPVDVEIVDKEETDQFDDVITENVKPGDDPTAKPESNKDDNSDKNKNESDKNTSDKNDSNKNDSNKNDSNKNDSNKNDSNKNDSNKNDKPSNGGSSNNKPNNGGSSNNKPNNGGNSDNKPNNGGGSNNKPSKPDNGGQAEKPQHKHSYSASVTKQPTCSSTGTRTYTCSCGDSYTESIPAVDHHWQHHDATGHYDKVVDQPAWDEPIYETRAVCGGCGAQFKTADEAVEHIMMDFGDACQNYHTEDVQTGTIHHEATYKDVWVQDSPAYDECTNCGARK